MIRNQRANVSGDQNHHYDCILMDHMMPEMDGIECLHALRAQPGGLCQKCPRGGPHRQAGKATSSFIAKRGSAAIWPKPVSGVLLEAAVLRSSPRSWCSSARRYASDIEKDILIFER